MAQWNVHELSNNTSNHFVSKEFFQSSDRILNMAAKASMLKMYVLFECMKLISSMYVVCQKTCNKYFCMFKFYRYDLLCLALMQKVLVWDVDILHVNIAGVTQTGALKIPIRLLTWSPKKPQQNVIHICIIMLWHKQYTCYISW